MNGNKGRKSTGNGLVFGGDKKRKLSINTKLN